MNKLYKRLKEKARGCRDRDVRVKLELFLLATRLGNITEACARRGFSRRFYYRWWTRFQRSGFDLRALEECSRRPIRSPNRISQKIEKRILWYSRRQYGARMIEALLSREGIKVSRSTICHVLKKRRRGPLSKKARLKTHTKRYELVIPGQRMQMDVKYVPEFVNGKRAYCYVIIDECTRWRFAQVYDQVSPGTTVEFLNLFKRHCPFPVHTIQTDNGQEFTWSLRPILPDSLEHPMDEWCRRERIRHRLIPPGVKELNGKVERSHRIDDQYFYWRASRLSLTHINHQLALWIGHYNADRPHGGIGYLTPLEKLHERRKTLESPPPGEPLPPELEKLRLRFIEKTPKSCQIIDVQLLRLEQELEALLKSAA